MSKLAQIGITLNFSPVLGHDHDILAIEAILNIDKSKLSRHFPPSKLDEIKDQLESYYKRTALKSFSGTIPLIFTTSEWLQRDPNAAPEPVGFEITIVYRQVWMILYYLDPSRSFLIKGSSPPIREVGQGLRTLPRLIQQVQPRFIILAKQFPDLPNQANVRGAFSQVLKHLSECGIEFAAFGTSAKELTWLRNPYQDSPSPNLETTSLMNRIIL